MKLLYDVENSRWYNENGESFDSNNPAIPYGNAERVEIQLYSEVKGANSGSAAVSDWTKYTGFTGSGYGAILATDNNFLHWYKTMLQTALSAGELAVTTTIDIATNVGIDEIAPSGNIYLYTASGSCEAIAYTSREAITGGIRFTPASGNELENAYTVGSQADIPEMLYAEATMVAADSDPATGLFVFNFVCDSVKLRNKMQYSSVERVNDCKGLELTVFQTNEDNTVSIRKRFRCSTFRITGGIADIKTNVPVPTPEENKILALLQSYVARGAVEEAISAGIIAAIAANGAIVSGAEFVTTVGDYTLDYTSGGLLISGGGVQFQVSGGAVTASGASGESMVLSGGALSAAWRNDDFGADWSICARYGGIKIRYNDDSEAHANEVDIYGAAVTVNSRPVLTALVTSTETEITSASIPVLSGGTSYLYTQPLYSLAVDSVVKSTEASFIHFTLDSVTAPTPVVISGVSYLNSATFEGGGEYLLRFFDGMVEIREVLDTYATPVDRQTGAWLKSGTSVINSGMTIRNVTVSSGTMLTVYERGKAKNATLLAGGTAHISSGGEMTGVTADGGRINIQDGGTLTSATMAAATGAANIYIYSGGSMSDITFDVGGLTGNVQTGATYTAIKENGGALAIGDANIYADTITPNTFSGLALGAGSTTVHSGTTALDVTLQSGRSLRIYSQGYASGVTVESGATLIISSGGTGFGITSNAGATVTIMAGAITD